MKKNLLLIFAFSFYMTSFSQIIPVRDPILIRNFEKISLSKKSNFHSSFRPYHYTNLNDSSTYIAQNDRAFLSYKILNKPEKKESIFYAIPQFELFNLFKFKEDKFYGLNLSLAALFEYSLGNKFAVSYQINGWYLSNLPNFLQKDIGKQTLYYGLGKSFISDRNIFIENELRIAYSPFEFLQLEAGNAKNFYGDGYRSLLLSDFAHNYPYLKLETSFLSLKYSCIWAIHQDLGEIEPITEILKTSNKYNVFHYLDWKIGDYVNLGLFEAVISAKTNMFSFEYLNPVIFFRPVEFSLGSEDNALLGINLKVKLNSANAFYSQFIIDDIIVGQLINDIKHNLKPDYSDEYGWFANKWAGQIGFKSFDIFKIKNLDFFTEINIARPYIYSHVHVEQSYSHLWQSLAHPLGANFIESVSGITYFNNRWVFDTKFMYATIGMDSLNTHFGQNIFQATMDGNQGYPYIVNSYSNTILQGVKTNIITSSFDLGYYIKKDKNLLLNVRLLFRQFIPEIGDKKNKAYIYLGIKSNFGRANLIY